MQPDGRASAEPHDSAPTPRRRQRRVRPGVVAVAAVVLLATGVFLVWYSAFDSINDAFDGDAGGECNRSGPRGSLESYTTASFLPRSPELADADRALKRLFRSERWRVDVRSVSSDRPSERRTVSVLRDGAALEFRFGDGARGRVTPDRTLLSTDDSAFLLSTCDDPSVALLADVAPAGCFDRHTRGSDTVVTFRTSGSGDCSSPTEFIEHEVVLRRDAFLGARIRIVTETQSSTETWMVRAPEELDDPWPWQVVPSWFVDLMAS